MNPEQAAAFQRMGAAATLDFANAVEASRRAVDAARSLGPILRQIARAAHPGREQYRRRYLRRGRARA